MCKTSIFEVVFTDSFLYSALEPPVSITEEEEPPQVAIDFDLPETKTDQIIVSSQFTLSSSCFSLYIFLLKLYRKL